MAKFSVTEKFNNDRTETQNRDSQIDRRITISALIVNTLLAIASLFLAKVGLDVSQSFNDWQVATTKSADHESRQQFCVQTALNAVTAMGANKDDVTDQLAGTISEIRAKCLAVGIDVPKLVVSIAIKAKKTQAARVRQPSSQSNRRAAEAVPNEIQISRLTDRFNLGEQYIPGFDVRGIGPSVERIPEQTVDDAIVQSSDNLVTAGPRLEIGIGVNWNSPFGPMRIDVAKALPTEDDEKAKKFDFDVGSQF